MEYILELPLPPTLNEQINSARTHWTKSASVKKKWTKLIVDRCTDAPQFSGKLWIAFDWRVKNLGRDPDNIMASAKYIMDGLKNAGVITEDSLRVIQSPQIHNFTKSKEDGVTVRLSDSFEMVIDIFGSLELPPNNS